MCIQIFVTRVNDPYGVRCIQGASPSPFPLPLNTQGHTGEAKPWISIWSPDTAPADFSTQQVWMVMSGRAYSSLWCKLISFIFTHRGAFFLFFPLFHTARSSRNERCCAAVSQKNSCREEYTVVVHCLEKGTCEQQQTSVVLL